MTTKSGPNVRLKAPDFRGIDRENESNGWSSGLGRLESAQTGKNPGDVW